MPKKEKEIGVEIVKYDDEELELVQINGETIGTIEEKDGKIICKIGDQTFHENTQEEAVQQVIREYNLHQR